MRALSVGHRLALLAAAATRIAGLAARSPVAILALASVVGVLAALAGLPRRDPWRGAYF